jgi:hypothetical protein
MSNFDLNLLNKQKETGYDGPKDKFGLTLAVHADKVNSVIEKILRIIDDIRNEYITLRDRID